MKTILVNVQIDEVSAKDLADVEEKIEKALKDYPRRRINYNLTDTFGSPLPPAPSPEA